MWDHQSTTVGGGCLNSKGSFTGDRWTQLTLLDSHHFVSKQSVSFFAVVNPSFPSMSERAGEFFAASASAQQKPVHCAAMIARKIHDKNADMDYHAVTPPEYRAGGDSKREEPCQQDPQRFTMTTTGASSSGRPVGTEDPSNTAKFDDPAKNFKPPERGGGARIFRSSIGQYMRKIR